MVLLSSCSNPSYFGCERTGSKDDILNPVRSASLRTINSFSFKYGKVEINAKLPSGDWLWSGQYISIFQRKVRQTDNEEIIKTFRNRTHATGQFLWWMAIVR